MSEEINLDLDPKRILEALTQISSETKKLASQIESSMRKAGEGVDQFEETAKNGSAKVSSFFRDLSHRVKEDLKEAFNVTGILAGAKFADEIQKGVKSVFDMELAFARLNTRLKMTASQLSEFKTMVGRKAAGAGQDAASIVPGVEIAASRGGISHSGQLGDIAGYLAQSKAITGEDTAGISDHVIEIMKNQKMGMNSENFKSVLDSLQGARASGGFHGLGDAGSAVAHLSQYTGTKMSVREMSGLAAQASLGGDGSVGILDRIMAKSKEFGGQQYINSVFGANLFKNGKFDASQVGKVNLGRFGSSQEQFGQIAGFEGASGSDLVRFVDSFKRGTAQLDKVVKGSNETATQFEIASDNLSTRIAKFRNATMEAGREVGDGLSEAANSLLKGDLKGAASGLKHSGRGVVDNAGTLAGAVALTAGVGVLAGGSIRRLMGKVGGTAAGLAEGQVMKAAGVTPVYVVNAAEIGGKGGLLGGLMDLAGGPMGKLGKFATGAGRFGLYGAAAYGGYEIGNAIYGTETGKKAVDTMLDPVSNKLVEMFDLGGQRRAGAALMQQESDSAKKLAEKEHISEAVALGIIKGMSQSTVKVQSNGPFTHPSDVKGRGGTR